MPSVNKAKNLNLKVNPFILKLYKGNKGLVSECDKLLHEILFGLYLVRCRNSDSYSQSQEKEVFFLLTVIGNFICASAPRIPRVRVLEDEEGSKDIELSDDPYDCFRLSVENVPCIVTLCKVCGCI